MEELSYMWQVFYKNGTTERESSDRDWVDIPKDGISAVQLIWEPFDWVSYLRAEFKIYRPLFPNWNQVETLLEISFQEYGTMNKALDKAIGNTTGRFQVNAEKIHDAIEQQYLEAKAKWEDENDKEAQKKAIYLHGYLLKIKSLRSFIGSYQHQRQKSLTLRAPDSPVAFFQHKHHITGMTKSFGSIVDEMFAQEIGMIVNKEGDYVSITMNTKSGHFITAMDSVHRIGLNLELHEIELERLP
jgi:hypothetical protein